MLLLMGGGDMLPILLHQSSKLATALTDGGNVMEDRWNEKAGKTWKEQNRKSRKAM